MRARATARVTAPGDYYQTFLLTIASLVRDVILEVSEVTPDEFDSYTGVLSAHLEAPGTITCQPLMWQAWGRRGELGQRLILVRGLAHVAVPTREDTADEVAHPLLGRHVYPSPGPAGLSGRPRGFAPAAGPACGDEYVHTKGGMGHLLFLRNPAPVMLAIARWGGRMGVSW